MTRTGTVGGGYRTSAARHMSLISAFCLAFRRDGESSKGRLEPGADPSNPKDKRRLSPDGGGGATRVLAGLALCLFTGRNALFIETFVIWFPVTGSSIHF